MTTGQRGLPPAGSTPQPRYAVVVPTIGRPSLLGLLASLASGGPVDPCAPTEVVVVDDRGAGAPALGPLPDVCGRAPRVVRAGGRGPAAARNLGWRTSSAPWVAFLDDDVLLPQGWTQHLAGDLAACGQDVAGSQARIVVPPPPGRPTDSQRGTAGLQDAAWVTADMAYRRTALLQVEGFDERFPRAYREDADLALRVQRAGWRLERGARVTQHPVRPEDDWLSVRAQAGNADDVLMRRLHGAGWREPAQAPPGRLRRHVLVTAAATAAVGGLLPGRRSRGLHWTGVGAAACWAALSTELVLRRLLPGPRPGQPGWAGEVRRMVLTSLVLPEAAVLQHLRGRWRFRGEVAAWPPPLEAVLLDRDGTLVEDVPYNGDPEAVRLAPGAREAVGRLRAAGLKMGVVSNQSGIGRGLLTGQQVRAVNARVEELLGPFDTWQVCPHHPDKGCRCRKPAPGLIHRAATVLGTTPDRCAVIGDIGADVGAALAAGARAVLVPTPVTRAEEVAAAPVVATSLLHAVDLVLGREML